MRYRPVLSFTSESFSEEPLCGPCPLPASTEQPPAPCAVAGDSRISSRPLPYRESLLITCGSQILLKNPTFSRSPGLGKASAFQYKYFSVYSKAFMKPEEKNILVVFFLN